MRGWRFGYWLFGPIAAAAIRAAGWNPLGLLLGWGAIGLAAELVLGIRALRTRPVRIVPPNATEADGEVGVAHVADVEGTPNAIEPRFRRFEGLRPRPDDEATTTTSAAVPTLFGRVAIVSVFLGRDGKAWSEAEVATALRSIARAGAWLEDEAIRWKAPLNVELADVYFDDNDDAPAEVEVEFGPEPGRIAPHEARSSAKALIDLSRAAARLGFKDGVEMTARINARIGADAHVWLLHPRRAGRSIAVANDRSDLPGVALAVCYAREASLPEPLQGEPYPDPVTFAHELLHLFGARDKYGVSLKSFPKGTVTPRDVMVLHYESLSRLRIDPRTAAEIGWST